MGPEKSADNARTRLIQPQSLRSLTARLPATRLLTSRSRPPLSASACGPRGETTLTREQTRSFFSAAGRKKEKDVSLFFPPVFATPGIGMRRSRGAARQGGK